MANYLYKNNSTTSNHYITQGYVHSNIKHVNWDYAAQIFNSRNSIDNHLAMLKIRYKSFLNKTLQVYDANTGQKLSIFDMNDNFLNALLGEMANTMNEKVDMKLVEAFAGYESTARSLSGIFNNSTLNDTSFDNMMNSIGSALQLVNSFDSSTWKIFCLQYKQLMQNRALMGSEQINKSILQLQGLVSNRSTEDPLAAVVKLLTNIPNNMIKSKDFNYTAKQMIGTLNSIFDTVIGESLIALSTDMIDEVDEEITSALISKAKLTGRDTVKSLTSDKKRVAGKVDVSKNLVAGMNIQLSKEGSKRYVIKGELNSSVKWYGNKKGLPEHISIQNISSFVALAKEIFFDDYSIYNTLAFNNEHHSKREEGFRIMRSSIIAKYLDRFIAGTGQRGSASGTIDTASFLVINGKFYPIYAILLAYLEDVKNKKYSYGSNNQGDLVYMSVYNINNDWIGDKSVKNYVAAMERSKIAKAAIDKFKVNISLNTKNLEGICNKYHVQGI